MTRLESALRELAGELSRLQRGIALVGGLAVSARTEPRLTRDVDLAVAVVDDADAETLIRQLAAAGYSAVAVVEQETVKRLASVRLATAAEGSSGIVADVLFASSGIEPEVVAGADGARGMTASARRTLLSVPPRCAPIRHRSAHRRSTRPGRDGVCSSATSVSTLFGGTAAGALLGSRAAHGNLPLQTPGRRAER